MRAASVSEQCHGMRGVTPFPCCEPRAGSVALSRHPWPRRFCTGSRLGRPLAGPVRAAHDVRDLSLQDAEQMYTQSRGSSVAAALDLQPTPLPSPDCCPEAALITHYIAFVQLTLSPDGRYAFLLAFFVLPGVDFPTLLVVVDIHSARKQVRRLHGCEHTVSSYSHLVNEQMPRAHCRMLHAPEPFELNQPCSRYGPSQGNPR